MGKIGRILIFTLPSELRTYQKKIGKIYAKEIGCKTVLNNVGGITGEFRKPNFEIIYGPSDTETTHKENGVSYSLDPMKVMFSSGNMDERIRMSRVTKPGEIVVDLFAGIGYFTLPIAVHNRPKKIYAVEKNPISYDYLCKNISLNNVNDIVEPSFGDNRKVAPEDIADRVIMGYFDTIDFLPIGINCLKNKCGIIHYHDKLPENNMPEKAFNQIRKIVEKNDKKAFLQNYKIVKSFAPGIYHYVFDIKIGEK